MRQRRAPILFGAGAFCLMFSIIGGGLSTGYSIIRPSAILLRAGVIYLTLGVVTSLFTPISIRDAILSALCAAGLVFLLGLIVMYYDLVLTPPQHGTIPTTHLLVGTQLQGVLITLPISTGYLSGVLVRANRQAIAMVVLLGTILGGWFGGSSIALSMGSAPGFTQMAFLLGIVATAGLALLPIVVMGWIKEISDWALDRLN